MVIGIGSIAILSGAGMIVGQDILDRRLIVNGAATHLKNSTYDLTIGEIIPIGKANVRDRQRSGGPLTYFIEPREMVWVLSKEEFGIPATVTGLATLKTSSTKQGLLALNVGIIDPLFNGPISTALINFSDRPRRIAVGERFFRIAFFEHTDVTAYHHADENTERKTYISELERASYSDFASNFLNVPTFDDDYYQRTFWKLIRRGVFGNWFQSLIILIVVGSVFSFLVHLGFLEYLEAVFRMIGDFLRPVKETLTLW